ncbi:HTH-type transcriptional repressor YtrA [Marinomonas spartinae]|uniref:HTH-type transcriptional repressor YtrA n=1 Tax=Marinomonas spartinae TaxID=1792290 RepID=A0A1A8T4Z3_9GAMM|nr:GntR family transcriptional regulator [Marinomonas spartinae]MBJ7555022.1 GntR family transcriptional regulator [Marinomonas spartinae]SBS26239.1 HTH-type transcriptional repressor YtrA [Marinomonas spartinae]SBS40048.1 HTH-type transcriptional repressor YtrA [Marinomonas spartinae]
MQEQWNDEQPIYRQVRDRMVSLILAGELREGEALPSVRAVSTSYQINHLTVSKAYQSLVEEKLVEKRRGMGMFILGGARARILHAERALFFQSEIPKLKQRLTLLDISTNELIEQLSLETPPLNDITVDQLRLQKDSE